jgi:hypothetical protein
MANEIKWSGTLGTFTTLIDGTGSAPTLKALASGGQKLGSAITGNRHRFCGIQLKCKFAVSPSSGGVVEVYFVPAVDNTQYGDGDDSVAPPITFRATVLPVRAVTTQQYVADAMVPLPPFNFKPLVINKSGQAMSNTDSENILSYRPYNEEIQ